jgi:hypothetical protein
MQSARHLTSDTRQTQMRTAVPKVGQRRRRRYSLRLVVDRAVAVGDRPRPCGSAGSLDGWVPEHSNRPPIGVNDADLVDVANFVPFVCALPDLDAHLIRPAGAAGSGSSCWSPSAVLAPSLHFTRPRSRRASPFSFVGRALHLEPLAQVGSGVGPALARRALPGGREGRPSLHPLRCSGHPTLLRYTVPAMSEKSQSATTSDFGRELRNLRSSDHRAPQSRLRFPPVARAGASHSPPTPMHRDAY